MANNHNTNNNNVNVHVERENYACEWMRNHKQQGKWVGMTPQGYLSARSKDGEALLVPDPERFDFIKSMLKALVSETCTIYDVKRAFDAVYTTPQYEHVGGRKIQNVKGLINLLCKPVYAGLVADFDDPTVLRRGRHEAMITEYEYWKLLNLLGREQ